MANVTIPQIAGVATTIGAADLFEISQAAVSKQATAALVAAIAAAPIDASASTLSLTTAQFGSTILFDRAAGCAVSLPAATGSGGKYKFVTKTVVTSNAYTVAALKANGDTFLGIFIGIDTSTQGSKSFAASAGNSNFITLNGGTTGGGAAVPGEYFIVEDIAANVWMVEENYLFYGTPGATPFSTV